MGKGVGDQVGGELDVQTNGLILSARGHMHDGGESMTVLVNNQEFCTSAAEYGTAYEVPKLAGAAPPAAGMEGMAGMAGHESKSSTDSSAPAPAPAGGMEAMHGHGAIPPPKNANVGNGPDGNALEPDDGKGTSKTISKMSECLQTFPVKVGDKMRLRAHYDLNAHPLRESGGEAQMQMGLVAFTWVPS
ncbi:hypothetical protein FKW77_001895 [Venturia effusa]|uniref:Uncharacterized protein n=1 Tax=Venturia effusa TaxID=50376 RepID=A0A517LD96_9PEZI|nr:hypothetical protein FKW77_001895 [Venturia effusa]